MKCQWKSTGAIQLQELYEKYGESKGLRILAFPSNQFGSQEPGSNEDIKKFAEGYNVTFDMFSKINVNGADAHPLWYDLQRVLKGSLWNAIKWNFSKFLINKDGTPVKRFAPNQEPKSIEKDLEKLW
ncbi:phospholipid-hydroperoxide glutathione peroxidase [Octopus vulgaris]|uniref:Glutathione peroxidase n=1 Tax=Octopus vulgaris TaxID=6645 RepID=A0AA36BSI1_OCTVU|nr:phospholipid-hydroperoxide glutathione peroxidase [Octopus vulgaris]